jgi:hypothetical protein
MLSGKNKDYVFAESFMSRKEAENYLAGENIWTHWKDSDTEIGKKYGYRCKIPKSKGPQCATGAFILVRADKLLWDVYKTKCLLTMIACTHLHHSSEILLDC